MTHPDIALDVQGRRTGEPERLHVGEHLGLEQAAFRPGTPESADQFIIHGTAVLIDQLDPLVAAVVRVAIVHDDVETI